MVATSSLTSLAVFFIMYFNAQKNWQPKGKSTYPAQRSNRTPGFNSDGDAAVNASKGSKPVVKTSSKSSRRHVNPLYVVIRRFHNVYDAYDENMQNTETKRMALNLAIGMSRTYYPDRFRFWQDLLDEANILLDSKRFCNSCAEMNLDPQAVAEHLVVEGKATLNQVLKLGLENYGEKAKMFHERLYVDTRNLYSKDDKVAAASETTES
jgi:hypothetical protein